MWKRAGLALFGLLLFTGTLLPQDGSDPEREALIAAIKETSPPVVLQAIAAPDQQSEAYLTVYECTPAADGEYAYELLEVVDSITAARHTVATQLRNCQGLGAVGLLILHWSADSTSLYYTDAREGQPDGGGFALWLPPVYRMEIESRESTLLGGGLFSPDFSHLAVWDDGALAILSDAGEEWARFDAYQSGADLTRLFWLPDGTGLIYVQYDYADPEAPHSYVIHVDAVKFSQTPLLITGD
jgi:hypothetical protein